MTIECIFAKLSYLLGKKFSPSKVKKMMMTNLRGELTMEGKQESAYSLKNNKMVQAIAKILEVTDSEEIKDINRTISPLLLNSVVATGNLTLL
jgi:lysophospholipase